MLGIIEIRNSRGNSNLIKIIENNNFDVIKEMLKYRNT